MVSVFHPGNRPVLTLFAGLLHELVSSYFNPKMEKEPERAKRLSCHIHEGSRLAPDDLPSVVTNFIEVCKTLLLHFSGGLFLVLEGPRYPAKHDVDEARKKAREKEHEAGARGWKLQEEHHCLRLSGQGHSCA